MQSEAQAADAASSPNPPETQAAQPGLIEKPPASGGSLTREQFLLPEIRKVATLRADGYSDDEIVDLAKADNIFQYPTTRMAQNIAKVCLRRLDMLAQPGLRALMAEGAGDPDQAAQANLYAMARTYRLMRDFLEVEVATRYLTFDYEFGAPEINYYFANLTLRNREAAKWSEATIGKLKQVLRQCLALTGMLEGPRGTQLVPILLDPAVREGIESNGDFDLLPAFACLTASR